VPGTTRDIVEGTIAIGGVPVRLLDTAGLDLPRDAIEAEGIRRSRQAMEESDLLLVVLDGSLPPDPRVLGETAERARVLVRAKSDLPAHPDVEAIPEGVAVSAITGDGIEALLDRLAREVELRAGAELIDALATALSSGRAALFDMPLEAVLVDLKDALDHAGAILGVDVGEAVLDRIFSAFCLGK
jgi:tRNA modification GTPase